MSACQNCGAVLGVSETTCSYCGTVTAGGIWQQHEETRRRREEEERARAQDHHRQAQAHHQRLEAERTLKSSAQNALIWSAIAVVICCPPIPAIVGMVLALRARGTAKKLEMPVPGGATVALVLSIVSMLSFVGLIVFSILSDQARQERIAEIDTEIGNDDENKKLDQKTACLLVERHVLNEGYKTIASTAVETVHCPGELDQDKKRAVLDEIQIKSSSESERALACFRRGDRWYIDRLDASSCDAEGTATSASASGSSSAAPGKSASPGSSAD